MASKDGKASGQASASGHTPADDQSSKRRAAPRAFASYDEARAFLRERLNVETMRPSQIDVARVFGLDRMRSLLALLGDPHKEFGSVHVAGSKGKGSVCEMTASCLEACGYTVGLYTSPHLVDLSERIRINQAPIPRQGFVDCLSRVAAAAAQVPKALGEPTYFELLTAAAFVHFADMAVDIAVVEVGMGGRGDATNVITPLVTAMTSIYLEHTQILGDTLEKITAEKAGICKPGVPLITVPQDARVLGVLRERAAAAGAMLSVLGEDIDFSYRFESSAELGPHARVIVTSPRSNFEHLPTPLRGEHQSINCGLALAILDALRAAKIDTPEVMVAQGLARTPQHGRLELVHQAPRVYVDGAHNPESIHALMRAVGAHVRNDSMVVVFGCAADKDLGPMLANLATGADKIIFTRATDNPRAADPRDLQRKFLEVCGRVTQAAPTVKDALNLAARAVARGDLILVTGSFAVAGEAKRLLQERVRDSRRAPQSPDALREVKPSAIDAAPSAKSQTGKAKSARDIP